MHSIWHETYHGIVSSPSRTRPSMLSLSKGSGRSILTSPAVGENAFFLTSKRLINSLMGPDSAAYGSAVGGYEGQLMI
jgi:hypothetical protein